MSTLTHPSPNHSPRAVLCVAVCLHWTGGTYASGVDWCTRRESKVSYHEIIGRRGELATLVEHGRSAWSVGTSSAPAPWKGKSGNSMTYNIALAGGPPMLPTDAQVAKAVERVRAAFLFFGWPLSDGHRVTGHDQWATPAGRKDDPQGAAWRTHEVTHGRADPGPWLDLDMIRTRITERAS